MAEEDDARIRVLQSLRGKICKCEIDVFVSAEEGEVEPSGRGAGGARRSVEAEADTRRSSAWCRLACYHRRTRLPSLL